MRQPKSGVPVKKSGAQIIHRRREATENPVRNIGQQRSALNVEGESHAEQDHMRPAAGATNHHERPF
jgi:hypothetical protein